MTDHLLDIWVNYRIAFYNLTSLVPVSLSYLLKLEMDQNVH